LSAQPHLTSVRRPAIDGWSQARRRVVVAVALLSYPVFVATWLGLPAVGVVGVPWAVAVLAALALVVVTNLSVYRFRRSMAQAPETDLDERQVAVRDRAYLEAYRIFSALVMGTLLFVAIVPDAIDRPLQVTYDTVQPFLLGVILYGIILPSAVVAWGEPDLDEA
jgi:hypothetical protein